MKLDPAWGKDVIDGLVAESWSNWVTIGSDVPHGEDDAEFVFHGNQWLDLGFRWLRTTALVDVLLEAGTGLRPCGSRDVLMRFGTVGSQMSIVHGRMKRHRGGGPHVLITVFVDHVLQQLRLGIGRVVDDGVMDRARGALERDMRVEVEVEFIRRRHISLDQTAWEGIALLVLGIPADGEGPNVVSLRGDHDGELALPNLIVVASIHHRFDMRYFLVQYMRILTLGNTVTDVVDMLGNASATNIIHPSPGKRR